MDNGVLGTGSGAALAMNSSSVRIASSIAAVSGSLGLITVSKAELLTPKSGKLDDAVRKSNS